MVGFFKQTLCSLVIALAGCADGSGNAPRLGMPRSVQKTPSPQFHNLSFLTKDQVYYNLNIIAYRKGAVVVDVAQNVTSPLRFYEAGPANGNFNVNPGDHVVLTDSVDEVTRVVRYMNASPMTRKAYFWDAPTNSIVGVNYNGVSFVGSFVVGNRSFQFKIESMLPYRLGFDNNGDGQFDGDEQAAIVMKDGTRIVEEDLLPK